jgi:transposase
VHPNQITAWKEQLLEGPADVFERGGNAKSSAPEVDIKSLHAKIGELVLENDFLERAVGKAGFPSAKR